MDDFRLDSWEHDLVSKYNIPGPTNDYQAYAQYPDHRHIYDKYKLSRRYNPGIYAGFRSTKEKCVIRPRFNFDGLGRGMEISSVVETDLPFGLFAQQFVTGKHLSIDIPGAETPPVVYRGWRAQEPGKFGLWQKVPIQDEDVRRAVHRFRMETIGIPWRNLEMIGGVVIEGHLRPSIQFWSRPEYSLVVQDYQTGPEMGKIPEWRPKEIHDVFLAPDERRLIVNGDDLRTVYHYACLVMGFCN